MRRILIAIAVMGTIAAAGATDSLAGDRPIQLALFNPLQIFPEDNSIKGVRLNLIYGKNSNVTALDLGIANHVTRGFQGLQFGIVGYVEGNGFGWQDNAVNIVLGDMEGLQSGLFNGAGGGKGVQWGLVNKCEGYKGFQLGFVNLARRYEGLQIGLVNVIQGAPHPFLPIVNWRF